MNSLNTDLPLADSGDLIAQVGKYSVRQNDTYRWLQEGSSIQLMMDRKQPSRLVLPMHHAMFLAIAAAENPSRILNLGCGLGALERKMASDFPFLNCISVDASVEIIELAKKFFFLPCGQGFTIARAEQYLQQDKQKYDVVFVDLFEQESLAECLYEATFYQGMSQRLGERGVVSINLIPNDQADLLRILLLLRKFFPTVWLAEVSGRSNIVLLGAKFEPKNLLQLVSDNEQGTGAFGFDPQKMALEFLLLPQTN